MSLALIEYYIKTNASKQILESGWGIFSQGDVYELILQEDEKTVEATVYGISGIYTVIINDYKNMNIEAKCNCPYNYMGICKHSVAALYQLVEDFYVSKLDAPVRKQVNITRKTSSPLLIERFNTLSVSVLRRYMNTGTYYYGQNSIKKIHLNAESLTFVVSGMFDQGYEYITKIYKKGSDYFLYCSCDQTVKFTCEHESIVLNAICNAGKRALPMFENGKLASIMHEACKTYELPEEFASQEFMHIELDENFNPILFFQGRLKGLVNEYSSVGGKNIYESFDTLVRYDKKKIENLFESVEEKKIAIGFVFQFFGDNNKNRQSVQPIIGKPNAAGNKIYSNIRNLSVSGISEIKISDKEKEAIILCEQIIGLLDNTRDDTDDPDSLHNLRSEHELLKELFLLLDGNNLIYSLKDQNIDIRKSNLKPVEISIEPLCIEAKLVTDDLFISLIPQYRFGDIIIDIDNEEMIRQSMLIWEYRGRLLLVKNVSVVQAISFVESSGIMKALHSKSDDFITNIVIPFSERFKIDIDDLKEFDTDEIFLKPQKKQVYLSEFEGYISFTPVVTYNHKKEFDAMTQGDLIEHSDGQIRIYKRNEDYENEFLLALRNLHPDFVFQEQEGAMALALPEMLKENWFFDAFESLKEKKIEVHGLQKLKSFKHTPYRATVNTGLTSGQDWFDINLEVSFGEQIIPLNKLKKHVLNKEKFIKLDDGTVGMLPTEWIGKLEKYFRVGEINKNQLQISKLRFSLVDELFDEIDDTAILQELAEKKKKLESFTEISKVRKPVAIKATMRDYQKEGLNWLNFLNDMEWGGILADDMGLGKTLQILAFLASLKRKSPKTSLVVVPTTLIFNWENEINKFYPSLKTMFYYGTNREKKLEQFKKHQLVITTYGLMVNDIDVLSKVKFNYIILDESQAIKNPHSKRYKAACLLKGKNKLTLTGTPIENNTFDLFAQMSFVNPGLLGTPKSFKDYYSSPIDKEKDPGRANELRKMISPFILRRTKEQVATELPPKTEDVIYCQMNHAQRAVYDEYKNRYRNYLLNKIDEEGLNKSKMYVLEGLLKLRQISNSPKLINDKENLTDESIKLDELMRQINEKTGKHKIVVFSQFVKMLKMIEVELKREDHNYEYFDGSSSQKKRRESVTRFQNDDACRVFLISLKAGGVGINLTAADYVYIFDPWWNPAVENQAIDRTYRIGQDKNVFAYRMICKDTVEEKIIKYQDQKKALAADIIRTDESFVKQLNQNDISDLFG